MKRISISLIVVLLMVTGLASPSAATDGYPPPPPPEECEPDCPPPPIERYVCPKGFTRVAVKVEVNQALEVGHQFLVGGNKVIDHASVETKKYLLVEICIEHAGDALASVVKLNAEGGELRVLDMCHDGTRGSQVELALALEATAGPRGGTIRITDQVLASDYEMIDVAVDGIVLTQETPPVEVRIQETHELDVPPHTTEKAEIRHRVCVRR